MLRGHLLMEEKMRILIVDDEKLIREIVSKIAAKRGADIVTLPGGKDVKVTLEMNVFNLAVVDLLMPDISGWDVVRMIRSDRNNCTTPIIILTGTKISTDEKIKLLQEVNAVVNKTTFTLQGFECIMDSCSPL